MDKLRVPLEKQTKLIKKVKGDLITFVKINKMQQDEEDTPIKVKAQKIQGQKVQKAKDLKNERE